MLQVIGLFFPAVLSMLVHDSIGGRKKEKDKWNCLKWYGSFTLLDTTAAVVIVKLMKPGIPFASNGNMSDQFLSVSYFVIVTVIAVGFGYLSRVAEESVAIFIREKNEKKEERELPRDEKNG